VGLLLRRIPALGRLVLAGEDAFVTFNIYGLAFSLVASASTVIRRRDTAILILAATVMWGIFMAKGLASEMIRFILFATLITVGVRMGIGRGSQASRGTQAGFSTIAGGILCAIGGLLYYWMGGILGAPQSAVAGGIAVGLLWGLSLGVAVCVGVSAGNEVIDWLVKRAR
jgi:hypothetical protein